VYVSEASERLSEESSVSVAECVCERELVTKSE